MVTEPFQKKKSLGQHFLTSAVVPNWMCDAGAITRGDTVVEIGPGTGVLTKELLARGAHVIAIEADERAIAVLNETFSTELAEGTLMLIHTDARTLDVPTLPVTDQSFKVVANIPYYLSGKLFRTFLDTSIQPTSLVFLVQKEVAERIARDEKESLLSLSVKIFGEPKYVRTVSKGHFTPPPKIDSAIVSISGITRNKATDSDREVFFSIIHHGFGEKRKQLLGNLAKQYDRETLMRIFSTLGIRADVRAEDVPLATWLRLTSEIAKLQ